MAANKDSPEAMREARHAEEDASGKGLSPYHLGLARRLSRQHRARPACGRDDGQHTWGIRAAATRCEAGAVGFERRESCLWQITLTNVHSD